MRNSLKENLEKNIRENVIPAVLPVVNQLKDRLAEGFDKRFPKETRDQVVQVVLTNILSAKETLEKTAKDVADQSRESEIMQKYVRPFVGSEKTEKALNTIEAKMSRARPLVTKLQTLREQFLASTAEKREEAVTEETAESTPAPKKRKSRSKSEADA